MSCKSYLGVHSNFVLALVAVACFGGCSASTEEEAPAEESTDDISGSKMTAALCGSSMFTLGHVAPKTMNGANVKHDVSGYITEINGKKVEYSQSGLLTSIGGKKVTIDVQGYVTQAYGHPVKMDSYGTITRVNDKEVGYGWRGLIEKIGGKAVEYDRMGDVEMLQGHPVEYVDYGLVKVTSKNRLVLCLAAYGDPA